MYQGHHTDGSSVQRHSAGGGYPFVVRFRESQAFLSPGVHIELIGPGIEGALSFGDATPTGFATCDAAVRRLQAVRSNEDAWAFELEQLMTHCGQKLAVMHGAASALADAMGTARFAELTADRRVGALLWLGKARNALRLPPGSTPPCFALLAAAAREF
ncbi:MAG: hypothetical protein RLZZ524_2362 [Pseudomonadota bacterium]|jgi:hypothetical protein